MALERLADLIAQRNETAAEIAELAGRPALVGHVGEFIASLVFNIELAASASQKGLDGWFGSPPLASRSVNVKWYGRPEGMLDLSAGQLSDYYLVMVGPRREAGDAVDVRPWAIDSVYLLESADLIKDLEARGVKLGIPTSVHRQLWTGAEIHPNPRCSALAVTDDQRGLLRLFAPPGRTTATRDDPRGC